MKSPITLKVIVAVDLCSCYLLCLFSIQAAVCEDQVYLFKMPCYTALFFCAVFKSLQLAMKKPSSRTPEDRCFLWRRVHAWRILRFFLDNRKNSLYLRHMTIWTHRMIRLELRRREIVQREGLLLEKEHRKTPEQIHESNI